MMSLPTRIARVDPALPTSLRPDLTVLSTFSNAMLIVDRAPWMPRFRLLTMLLPTLAARFPADLRISVSPCLAALSRASIAASILGFPAFRPLANSLARSLPDFLAFFSSDASVILGGLAIFSRGSFWASLPVTILKRCRSWSPRS